MILRYFRARDFRNIKDCSIEFSEGVNLLLGENAQGKTNAIEAIYMFARGKSFRKAEDKSLISFGKEGFYTEIGYTDKNGDGTLEYSLFGNERRRKKNGYKLKGVSELIGSFRAVLFVPDDLNLVKGGPDERRDFLNVSISQCYPSYIGNYRSFKNALENRNALLKQASKGFYFDERELIAWSEVLAEHAAYVHLMRASYIKKLGSYAAREMTEISSGKEVLDISYKASVKDSPDIEELKARYKIALTENIERERAAGVSLFGPQRDDIVIKINSAEARGFASQGQQRSTVLALKLAEGEVCYEITGEYPVYLLDDVLSELDSSRQRFILSKKENRQIIISGCDMNSRCFEPDRIIEVKGGNFT